MHYDLAKPLCCETREARTQKCQPYCGRNHSTLVLDPVTGSPGLQGLVIMMINLSSLVACKKCLENWQSTLLGMAVRVFSEHVGM